MALPSIPDPSLVVIDHRDTTTLPGAGRSIAVKMPDVRHETLAPARHLGLIGHHERFCHIVEDFIASRRPPSGV
jgi:hypothetical protein